MQPKRVPGNCQHKVFITNFFSPTPRKERKTLMISSNFFTISVTE